MFVSKKIVTRECKRALKHSERERERDEDGFNFENNKKIITQYTVGPSADSS